MPINPASYPFRGEVPWDDELREYIDTGDTEADNSARSYVDQKIQQHAESGDHDGRYYTKQESDDLYLTETEGDARYLTQLDTAQFLTEESADTLYYPRDEADAAFVTEAEGNTLWLTEATADGLFLTQDEGDARYQPIGGGAAGNPYEIIHNYGFENGTEGPHTWGTSTRTMEASTVHSGSWAVKFDYTAAAGTVVRSNGDLSNPEAKHPRVQVGERWVASAWVRGDGDVDQQAKVRLHWRTADGTDAGSTGDSTYVTLTSSWKKIGVSGEPPVGASYVALTVDYSDPDAAGTLYVDDLDLRKVEHPNLVSPADWGGVGDSSHDDRRAVQAAIDFVRSKAGTPWRYVVDLGEKVFRINTGVEASGIDTVGFTIQNGGILAACPGHVAMNFAGTQGLRLRNFRMWGDATNSPDVGVYIGYSATERAVDCHLIGVTLMGHYVRCTIVALGAETSNFTECQFHNNFATATSFVYANVADFTALNANFRNDPAVTAFVNNGIGEPFSPAGTYRSNIGHYEHQVNYKKNTTLGPAVLLHGVGSMRWDGGYVLVLDGGRECVRFDMRYGATTYDCDLGFQAEQHPTHVFSVIGDSGATEVMTGMTFRVTGVGPDALDIQSLMNIIPAGVSSLQLRGVKMDLSNFNPSGTIFSPAGKVVLLGADITLQNTGVALGQSGSVRGIVHYAQGGNSVLNPA